MVGVQNVKKVIIETDQRLNDCLRQRKAQLKGNLLWVPIICFFVGLFAFYAIIGSGFDSEENNNLESKNVSVFKALRHIDAGNFKQAEDILINLHAKQPNYSTVNELLGYINLQQDELEQAFLYYQNALPYSTKTKKIKNAIAIIERKLKDEQQL